MKYFTSVGLGAFRGIMYVMTTWDNRRRSPLPDTIRPTDIQKIYHLIQAPALVKVFTTNISAIYHLSDLYVVRQSKCGYQVRAGARQGAQAGAARGQRQIFRLCQVEQREQRGSSAALIY